MKLPRCPAGLSGASRISKRPVVADLELRRVERAGLCFHAGAELHQAAGVAGQAAVAELEDHVLRRLAAGGRRGLAAPVAVVAGALPRRM